VYPGVGVPDPGAQQFYLGAPACLRSGGMEANPRLASSARQLGSRFGCDGRGVGQSRRSLRCRRTGCGDVPERAGPLTAASHSVPATVRCRVDAWRVAAPLGDTCTVRPSSFLPRGGHAFRRCDAPYRVIAPETGRERLVGLWRSERGFCLAFFTGPPPDNSLLARLGGKSWPSTLLKLASGGLAGERCSGRQPDQAVPEVLLG
jgi:hypothetical protein